jgi:hypothetical protein
MNAPIILFIYNRPIQTQLTLESLKKNFLIDDSIVFIYSDGPKNNATDVELVIKTREIAKSKNWAKETILIENEKNQGLTNAVIKGIDLIFQSFDKIIVLEDDLILSPYFLKYINSGLEIYKDVQNVYSINGYIFPIKTDRVDTFLNPMATSSWGWGTWKSKWGVYEKINEDNRNKILANVHLTNRFNFADYDFSSMILNKNSWAINWYFYVFARNGLGVFPSKTLVKNIGFDGSGTNCEVNYDSYNELYMSEIIVIKKVEIELYFYDLLLKYFSLESRFLKLKKTILKIFKKL